jgi:hypothetical protein
MPHGLNAHLDRGYNSFEKMLNTRSRRRFDTAEVQVQLDEYFAENQEETPKVFTMTDTFVDPAYDWDALYVESDHPDWDDDLPPYHELYTDRCGYCDNYGCMFCLSTHEVGRLNLAA